MASRSFITSVALASCFIERALAYHYVGTTTRYGETPGGACGVVDTRDLVAGTNYYVVASAQSMQSVFEAPHSCKWECSGSQNKCQWTGGGNGSDGHPDREGCSCRQVGDCMCGQSGSGSGGTARLGCFTCAKGRFLRHTPYDSTPVDDTDFITEEINLIVGDICPYGSNAQWCPGKEGDVNAAGKENHLDFTNPPAGAGNNNYFAFSPSPCSAQLIARAKQIMQLPCPWMQDSEVILP